MFQVGYGIVFLQLIFQCESIKIARYRITQPAVIDNFFRFFFSSWKRPYFSCNSMHVVHCGPYQTFISRSNRRVLVQPFDADVMDTLTFQRTYKLCKSTWEAGMLNDSPACERNHTEKERPYPSKAPEFPSEPDVFFFFFLLSLHNVNSPTHILRFIETKHRLKL